MIHAMLMHILKYATLTVIFSASSAFVAPSTAPAVKSFRQHISCTTNAQDQAYHHPRQYQHHGGKASFFRLTGRRSASTQSWTKSDDYQETQNEGDERRVTDPRVYSVRIPRVTGIEWGSDLSFRWVYVRKLEPAGAAAECGDISVGDQLVAINDQDMAGAPFDHAMGAMMQLQGSDVKFTFFRGSQGELQDLVGAEALPEEISVTVKQKGKADIVLKAPGGANLRNLLVDNGINVYQSVTRWTNCKGKQLCGTCIVEINQGLEDCTIKSLDESSTLRDNPPNYRLSCVTNMYDDVTVTVFPPIGAAQWTR